jgi:hypothetical protein
MVHDQRLATDFEQGLWYPVGQRTHALAASCRQDDGFQNV